MKSFTFNNGIEIPAIGLGTWRASEEDGYNAVLTALKTGYRHIDGAANYGNESYVGKAIRDSGIPRSEIFVTTKLSATCHHQVGAALDKSLHDLGLDYVDLYLMHWPVFLNPEGSPMPIPMRADGTRDVVEDWDYLTTWKSMENLSKDKVKSIGVCNFSIQRMDRLLRECSVQPVVNQVELHPMLPQDKLKEFCSAHGVILEAYSPLGSAGGPVLENETIKKLAEKYNASAAQICISWAVWRGTVVLPKSITPSRIESNFKMIDLSTSDGQAIDKISDGMGTKRYVDPPFGKIKVFDD